MNAPTHAPDLLLRVTRHLSVQHATIGELHWSLDQGATWTFLCFTLEDEIREIPGKPVQEWKIPKETAIPQGTYKVIVDRSTRFKIDLPHILDVPGFGGIRIHGGNKAENTEGCLLVAHRKLSENFIQGTVIADVMALLLASGNKATIEYINPPAPVPG